MLLLSLRDACVVLPATLVWGRVALGYFLLACSCLVRFKKPGPVDHVVHENVRSVGVSPDCVPGCVALSTAPPLSRFLLPHLRNRHF